MYSFLHLLLKHFSFFLLLLLCFYTLGLLLYNNFMIPSFRKYRKLNLLEFIIAIRLCIFNQVMCPRIHRKNEFPGPGLLLYYINFYFQLTLIFNYTVNVIFQNWPFTPLVILQNQSFALLVIQCLRHLAPLVIFSHKVLQTLTHQSYYVYTNH